MRYKLFSTGAALFFGIASFHNYEKVGMLEPLVETLKDSAITITHDTTIYYQLNEQDLYHVTLTKYQPSEAQCDSDPYSTADGGCIDSLRLASGELRWCALSRDLLTRWGGPFSYGDTIHVFSPHVPAASGWWVVHDCMSEYTENEDGNLIIRTNWIDILQWWDSTIHGINNNVLISNQPI